MDVAIPLTEGVSGHRAHTASAAIEIPQYRRRTIFAIWAAAALPDGRARLDRRAGPRPPPGRREATSRLRRP